MKEQIISEINDIRRIMGLSLITEGRDDLIALMKKLSSETASEDEKTEIKNILKKMGTTDDEIAQLVRGSERTLGELSKKLSGQFSQEISQELEKVIIKSGAAAEAFREISGQSKLFVDKMDELYRAYKNGTITYDDYIKRKEFALNIYDQNFKRSELQRAIDSIEKSVDDDIERAFKEGKDTKKSQEVKTDTDANINPSIVSDEITDDIIDDPDKLLKKLFKDDATIEKVKKEFSTYTPEEIADQYEKFKNNKYLSDVQKAKWDKFIENIDKNSWQKLSTRTRLIITIAVLFGPNLIYILYKLGALKSASSLLLAIPVIGPIIYAGIEPSEEEQKIEDQSKDRVEAVKRLRNYIVIDKNTKKRVDIDTKKIYLNDLMDTFSNPSNDILKKIEEKINNEVDTKKERLANADGLYAVGAEIATEINKILESNNPTNNFNVEYVKFDDVDFDKPVLDKGIERFTSLSKDFQEKLKTYLSIVKNKKEDYNWNPKPNTQPAPQKLPANF